MDKRETSAEEKIKGVENYLRGELSLSEVACKYSVSKSSFLVWVSNYQVFGREGVQAKHRQKVYSTELQKATVEDYLSGKGSQKAICKKYKISSKTQLQNRIKQYNGHRELRSGRGQGNEIYMTKGRKNTYGEQVEIVSYCIGKRNGYTAAIEKYGSITSKSIHGCENTRNRVWKD